MEQAFDLQAYLTRGVERVVSGALGAMLDLGKGSGPMAHSFGLSGRFAEEAVNRD